MDGAPHLRTGPIHLPNRCEESKSMAVKPWSQPKASLPKKTLTSGSKVQSVIGGAQTSCKTCGMSYYAHVDADRKLHQAHHAKYTNGPKWTATAKVVKQLDDMVVVEATKKDRVRVEGLLALVNQELQAPNIPIDDLSKAFICVAKGRAVGFCATEAVPKDRGRWMIHRTQTTLERVNPAITIGISRIWVASAHRGRGIGLLLLEAVQYHLVYCMVVSKNEIAFSQPSAAGAKLAAKFNGVTHKNGDVLIPVYIDD